MWKRLTVLLMCLMMALPVLAEEVPTLPGQFTLDDLPENLTFDVYTGPDDSYLQAAGGQGEGQHQRAHPVLRPPGRYRLGDDPL